MSAPLAIEPLVDGQRFGRFGLELLALSFLAMFADGYDLAVMGFAAPALARAWHLPAAGFAPVLTASLVGILFGAPLLAAVESGARAPALQEDKVRRRLPAS